MVTSWKTKSLRAVALRDPQRVLGRSKISPVPDTGDLAICRAGVSACTVSCKKIKVSMDEQLFSDLFVDAAEKRGA